VNRRDPSTLVEMLDTSKIRSLPSASIVVEVCPAPRMVSVSPPPTFTSKSPLMFAASPAADSSSPAMLRVPAGRMMMSLFICPEKWQSALVIEELVFVSEIASRIVHTPFSTGGTSSARLSSWIVPADAEAVPITAVEATAAIASRRRAPWRRSLFLGWIISSSRSRALSFPRLWRPCDPLPPPSATTINKLVSKCPGWRGRLTG
jgi:hypothetical protein